MRSWEKSASRSEAHRRLPFAPEIKLDGYHADIMLSAGRAYDATVAVAGRSPLGPLEGAACGLTAVSIWAGWSVVTRLAVTTGLDAWDIPALRFGVAGLLLLPILIR